MIIARRILFVGLLLMSITSAFCKDRSLRLEPISPYSSDIGGQYRRLVFNNVFGSMYLELWMIAYPSLNPEYAVGITRKFSEGTTVAASEFIVAAAKLASPAWPIDWKPSKGVDFELQRFDLSADTTASIAPSDAEYFIDTWFKALAFVEYSESLPMADGSSFDFFSNGRAGRAYDPSGGVPLLMAESGRCLFEFATAPQLQRQQVIQKCRAISNQINNALR